MPMILAQLLGGLAMAMSSLIGRGLVALGLGFATYVGVNALVSSIEADIIGFLNQIQMSPSMLAWAGFFQIDRHFSLVLSAVAVRVLMAGIQDGVKRLVRK
ncbi:DUF2523 family protein [Comamonas aquatica]|uniref:DUF2523 family protein n=1 Tax=Comamonas aquatica TaxID=225991 RepID=UPI00244CF716|nr:DUF2523 family protein [Comamonas aquatica]MDH1903717.1 DUF2523 domain-containing protein [Comamonas aquatica]